MKLWLSDDFADLWSNKDPFVEVGHIQGEMYREQPGRRTLCFTLNGRAYFLKQHTGVGWREIVKNLMQFRLPILGASHEFRAVELLSAAGVETMQTVAYGELGANPAKQQSFIITEALENTISLEDLALEWQQKPPSLKVRRAILKRVANMVRGMHQLGLNHRDCYLCHFLLEQTAAENIEKNQPFSCHLIDLHRAQYRKKVPKRMASERPSGLVFFSLCS